MSLASELGAKDQKGLRTEVVLKNKLLPVETWI